jgi:hypothetical protein
MSWHGFDWGLEIGEVGIVRRVFGKKCGPYGIWQKI